MAVEQKDIDQVVEVLDSKFKEFKSANDSRLDSVSQEKAALAGKVTELFEEVKGLQKSKDTLELQLKEVENAQARPGQSSPDVSAHKEAFSHFMRKGGEDGLRELEQKALNLGADDDGGYAVPEEVDRNVSQMLRHETPMRQVARIIPVGSEEYKALFSVGGAAWGWVGEDDPRDETGTPKLAKPSPSFGEIYANPAVTQKTIDDMWFDPEAWLAEELMMEFAEGENQAYTSGDGNNKPIGYLSGTLSLLADPTRPFGQYQQINSSASGAIRPDDIKRFPLKLKAGYRRNASWMMQTATLEEISVMKDANDNYLWRPGLTEGTSDMLVNRPIVENEDMPAMAAGANAVSLGDFKRGYYILDRMGTRVLRDPFTNKPYVHFYTTKRVGGMKADTRAIKVLTVAA